MRGVDDDLHESRERDMEDVLMLLLVLGSAALFTVRASRVVRCSNARCLQDFKACLHAKAFSQEARLQHTPLGDPLLLLPRC